MSTTRWKQSAAGLGVMALTSLQWTSVGLASVGLASVAGCASDGVVTADLEYVDSSIASRRDLFIDPSLAGQRPMTLAQLGGEREGAIAVEVEVFGPVAAAWRRADDGGSLPRTSENLVSLWRVRDVRSGADLSTAETIDRELEGGLDYHPSTDELPTVEGVDIERPGDRINTGDPDERLYLLIDWVDRLRILREEDVELARLLNENHPGCL